MLYKRKNSPGSTNYLIVYRALDHNKQGQGDIAVDAKQKRQIVNAKFSHHFALVSTCRADHI